MKRDRKLCLLFLCGLFLPTACASSSNVTIYPPYEADEWQALDIEQIMSANAPEGDWSVQVIDLATTPSSSTHLVRVRHREKTHFHAKHDITAIMVSGKGELYIGEDQRSLKPGDVVTIPRHVLHEFVNESGDPSVFYVIFSPPYEADDHVRVKKMEDLLQ